MHFLSYNLLTPTPTLWTNRTWSPRPFTWRTNKSAMRSLHTFTVWWGLDVLSSEKLSTHCTVCLYLQDTCFKVMKLHRIKIAHLLCLPPCYHGPLSSQAPSLFIIICLALRLYWKNNSLSLAKRFRWHTKVLHKISCITVFSCYRQADKA